MSNLKFEKEIDASPAKAWNILFSDEHYPEWTAAFCTGSHAITDWQQGSKTLFLDDQQRGMIATLDKVVPNEFMSIRCLGEVMDGKEDYDGPGALAVKGALENYTLTKKDGKTLLTVELTGGNFSEDIMNFFLTAWPKALADLKELAEK